ALTVITHERRPAIRRKRETHERGARRLQHFLGRMQIRGIEDVDLAARQRREHALAVRTEEHLVEPALEAREANLVDIAVVRSRVQMEDRLREVRYEHGLAIG